MIITEYAVYKGDKFIDLGTAKELAVKLNIKENSVRFLASKAHRERCKDISDRLIAIRLEEEEAK